MGKSADEVDRPMHFQHRQILGVFRCNYNLNAYFFAIMFLFCCLFWLNIMASFHN